MFATDCENNSVISSVGSDTYKVWWSHKYEHTVTSRDTIRTDSSNFETFPPCAKWALRHPSEGPWDARHRLFSVKSLFCNLKWLLLSSRLQALCCPRCWSLRSKMRLPQCCERGLTQGKRREGRKELTVLGTAPLTHARTSFFTLLYHRNHLSTFFYS